MNYKKEKSTQSSSGTATVTPNLPGWVTQTQRDYDNLVGALFDERERMTPGGQNALQAGAGQLATSVGNAGGNYAQSRGYDAAGYSAPQVGSTALAGANGYTATNAQAASAGPASQITGKPYAVQAGQAQAGSMLDNLKSYMDPNIGAVVDTTLAGFDQQASRQKAAMDAQAGRDRAFGGSGYAIREGVYGADSDLNRAATEAGLRSNAFNTAAGLSASDAALRTGVSQTNAGLTTQANTSAAGLNATRDIANLDARNQFALTDAGFEQSANLADAGYQNQASLFGAGAKNTASLANASAQNQTSLANAGFLENAGQFSTAAQNQASQFEASAYNNDRQFDAQQKDAALNRQLQAAGLMGDLGDQQYQLETMRQQYPLQFAAIMQQLSAFDPSLFAGQTTNQSGSSKGSSSSIGASIGWSPAGGLQVGG